MIHQKVSAVLMLRDSFSGRRIQPASGLQCRLNGRPFHPVRKLEGYLVLTDLPPGEHILKLTGQGYREEQVFLPVQAGQLLEQEVDLKPGRGYRLPVDTAWLKLTLPEIGEETVWAAMADGSRLKLSRDLKPEGKTGIPLFYPGNPEQLPIPGSFLLVDEKNSELLHLRSLQQEQGVLSKPLQYTHVRGAKLQPAWKYRTNEAGEAVLLFPTAGEILLFCRSQLFKLALTPGTQSFRWDIK